MLGVHKGEPLGYNLRGTSLNPVRVRVEGRGIGANRFRVWVVQGSGFAVFRV